MGSLLPEEAGVSGSVELENHLQAVTSLLRLSWQPVPLNQILQAFVETVSKRFGGLLTEIWEEDDREGGELVRRAVHCGPGLSAHEKGSEVSGRYAARCRGLLASRAPYQGSPFPDLPPELEGGQCPPVLLAQPIQVSGEALGLLTLYRSTESDRPTLRWFQHFAELAFVIGHYFRSTKESERAIARLRSVVEASKMLHTTLDLFELLEVILRLAASEVGAERGTLYLVDPQSREIWSVVALGLERQEIRLPFGQGVAGYVAEKGEILIVPDAYQSSLFDASFDQRFGYHTRNILCLPIRNNRGEMLGVLELLNKPKSGFQQEDIDILVTLSVHIALALENAQRHRELLAKQRIEKELALARSIQRSFLPTSPPFIPGYDIAVLNVPCFEVGGDYYDFLSLGGDTLLLVIADVEGKGVSSALIMSNLQASLRALVMNLHSLEVIIASLNHMIHQDTKSQRFVSVFLGLIDTRGGGLHYINAGHVPPLLIRGPELTSLDTGGLLIGLFDSPDYSRGKVKLLPGDILLFYTDGIVEATAPTGEEFGTQRLLETVAQNRRGSAQQLVEIIGKDIEEFSRSNVYSDDRVLIVMKIRETPRD